MMISLISLRELLMWKFLFETWLSRVLNRSRYCPVDIGPPKEISDVIVNWGTCNINRGSNMSAHVLLNLFNELGKRDKMRGLPSILSLFATSLINSIIQEHEC